LTTHEPQIEVNFCPTAQDAGFYPAGDQKAQQKK
jgi:hypothetical protein